MVTLIILFTLVAIVLMSAVIVNVMLVDRRKRDLKRPSLNVDYLDKSPKERRPGLHDLIFS